jgi:hypothetical protein
LERATGTPSEAIERAVRELPVYTREELEAKLEELDEIIGDIYTLRELIDRPSVAQTPLCKLNCWFHGARDPPAQLYK